MKHGHAAVAAVALLTTGCSGVFVGPDPKLDRLGLFERVWRDVDRYYSLFSVKGVAWDSLHDTYAPRAAQAASDSELGDVVGAILSELHDIHVNLAAGPQFYRYSGYDARPAFFDPGVVAQYVTDRHAAPNAHSAFGHAAPDIGYVWILHFAGSGFGADIDTALAQLADVRALIIDVRDNPGGQSSNLEAVASRFTDRDRTYAFTRVRDGPRHDDLSPREPQVLSPEGPRRFTGPVAVLTNRKSMSTAEGFVLAMRALPGVTIVGDSTEGGAGNPVTRELPNGWTYRFPFATWYAPDGATFEEIGLAPDVWVRGSAEELAAGRDAVLDTALAVLRRSQ